MDEQELKDTIAGNIAEYRKAMSLTQAELAERLNYSDKAISKWERAEALPDIFVLKQLADLYGITLDELTQVHENKKYKPKKGRRRTRFLVPLLSAGIVWLVVTVIFSILAIAEIHGPTWLVFVGAVPVTCIVLIVFGSLWWSHWSVFGFVTGLIWSVALSLFLGLFYVLQHFTGDGWNAAWFFIIAVPLQVLEILWAFLKAPKKKKKPAATASAASSSDTKNNHRME